MGDVERKTGGTHDVLGQRKKLLERAWTKVFLRPNINLVGWFTKHDKELLKMIEVYTKTQLCAAGATGPVRRCIWLSRVYACHVLILTLRKRKAGDGVSAQIRKEWISWFFDGDENEFCSWGGSLTPVLADAFAIASNAHTLSANEGCLRILGQQCPGNIRSKVRGASNGIRTAVAELCGDFGTQVDACKLICAWFRESVRKPNTRSVVWDERPPPPTPPWKSLPDHHLTPPHQHQLLLQPALVIITMKERWGTNQHYQHQPPAFKLLRACVICVVQNLIQERCTRVQNPSHQYHRTCLIPTTTTRAPNLELN